MPEIPKELTEVRKFEDEEIEVVFRKARTREEADPTRYSPPLLPSVSVENGIRIERDVAVPLRDGVKIYTDIYRPDSDTDLPAIVAWSPFGKRVNYNPNVVPMLSMGVPPGTISKMAKFEAPDPAYWCHHGYAIINPDARGAHNSEGDIACFGTQEGRDGYDLIEWVAAREWCSGKVGMAGNSWLAMTQWFIAAEHPPHLVCISPWEGTSDVYREFVCCGGIPEVGFNDWLIGRLVGHGCAEDYLATLRKYPLMNKYWEDKIPCL